MLVVLCFRALSVIWPSFSNLLLFGWFHGDLGCTKCCYWRVGFYQQTVGNVFFRLDCLIFQRKHMDLLHNFDSCPMTFPILSQLLSFGHKYHKK